LPAETRKPAIATAGSSARKAHSDGGITPTARSLARTTLATLRAQARATNDNPAYGGAGTRLERLGLTAPELHMIGRRLARDARTLDGAGVAALARMLVDDGTLEGGLVAYELLGRRRDARAVLDASSIERLARGMDNWCTVDTLASEVVGRAWSEARIADSVVRRWARSKDRWWRRLALASVVALNVPARGGAGDPARTLALCEMLAADRDDMVVKALSWALRSLVRHEPTLVRTFLTRHGDVLAARVRREVKAKLETGLKSGRRA
jgi:3-methyladenine DNA glycosylase AlkD